MTDTVHGRDDARPEHDPITLPALIDLADVIPDAAVLTAARNILTAVLADGAAADPRVRLRRLGLVAVLLLRAAPDLIDVLYAKEVSHG